jgi:hypothetical protein
MTSPRAVSRGGSVHSLLCCLAVLSFTSAPSAAGSPPPSHSPAAIHARLAGAANDPALAPWQRDFMLRVARGSEGSSLIATPAGERPAVTERVSNPTDGAWEQLPVPMPSAQNATFDPVRDRLVVLGAKSVPGTFDDAWALSLSDPPRWTALHPAGTLPPARYGHSVVYDPVRDRMLLFGGWSYDGEAYSFFNDVWALSLSGTPTWSLLTPAGTPPAARSDHSAIYDPVRDRMIVFGGYYAVVPSGMVVAFLNDVRVLSLAGTPTWTQLGPGGPPPTARCMAGAIYDPVRDRIVVFGGYTDTSPWFLGDVWTLSLSGPIAWRARTPAGTPPIGRRSPGAIYDPVRDRMVTFGGGSSFYGNLNDLVTLTLSGSMEWNWPAAAGTAPGPRTCNVIYDPVRDRMVLWGKPSVRVPSTDSGSYPVWTLSLAEPMGWANFSPEGTPIFGREGHNAVYDAPRDRMIAWGGFQEFSYWGTDVEALSLGSEPAWTTLRPGGAPPSARSGASAIADPVRELMLVFGGYGDDGTGTYLHFNDVHALRLAGPPDWTSVAALGAPPGGRTGHSAIYDPVRDRMLVFGGSGRDAGGASVKFSDVWSLTLAGTPTWLLLTPGGSSPDARSEHGAIYDPVRDRMLVFGGAALDSPYVRTDVWSLSLGETPQWTEIVPAGTPPVRPYAPGAIYDPGWDRMVVFGSYEDGSIGPPPPGRGRAGPAAPRPSPARASATPEGNETWALSLAGTPEWTLLVPEGPPPVGRKNHSAIYDPVRHRMVVIGGRAGDLPYTQNAEQLDDVWALVFQNPSTATLVSLVSCRASPDHVALTWQLGGGRGSVTIDRRESSSDWQALGSAWPDGMGQITWTDRDVTPGGRYGYRLRLPGSAGMTIAGETWVEVPVTLAFALDGARPNPGTGHLSVSFTLPVGRPASIELLDIQGRLIVRREVGSLGAGRHVIGVAPDRALPTGIYLVRLTQEGRTLTTKATVLE